MIGRSPATAGAALVVGIAAMGTAAATAAATTRAATHPRVVRATRYVRVTPAGKDPVLLEGGTFGPDGRLYFVNGHTGPGAPKVLRLDTRTRRLQTVYSDRRSDFTSTQFSPADGRLYLTEYFGREIVSMTADGSDLRREVSGPVDGRPMTPDDIAFDPRGDLFVTDATGTPWNPTGRVIRFDPRASHPTVLLSHLAAPNGISFSPDGSRLWVSEYTAQREDVLTLDARHRSVTAASVGMRFDTGVGGFDSNSVDAAGNVYQTLNGDGRILVWSDQGVLREEIEIPQTPGRSELAPANLVIRPGTRQGYAMVGGAAGGFVYRFRALARGIMSSNGGGALPGRRS